MKENYNSPEMEIILSMRRKAWKKPEIRRKEGVLKLFSDRARSPMQGGGSI